MSEQSMDTSVLRLCNEHLVVDLEPRRGGRTTRLLHRPTGVDWLIPTPAQGPTAHTQDDGDPSLWQSHPRGGWDECFPSIAATTTPAGEPVGDHGDLWSRSWDPGRTLDSRDISTLADAPDGPSDDTSGAGASVELSVNGPRDAYTLTKTLSLEGPTLAVDYLLTSHTDSTLPYLWSAHPLMPADADIRAALPNGTPMVIEYADVLDEVEPGDILVWGERVPGTDWILGERPDLPVALKGFTTAPVAPSLILDGSRLTLRASQEDVPVLGVWLNYGAWPTNPGGDRHIAFEPTTAQFDDLRTALVHGEGRHLRPQASTRWRIELTWEETT